MQAHARPAAKAGACSSGSCECLTTGRRSGRARHPALAVRQTPESGRSSDFQARPTACLLAAGPGGRTAMARNSRPHTPGHSGGAVPDSHRSSLFAGWKQLFPLGHQSRWKSLLVAGGVSITRAWARSPARFDFSRSDRGKPCGSRMAVPRRFAGRARLRRTVRQDGIDGSLNAMRSRKSPLEKYLGLAQAAFTGAPIAPMSPGASLCPSGNQGAAATCDPSSHGMARQACRGEFVDHNLGVTASQAGRPHR